MKKNKFLHVLPGRIRVMVPGLSRNSPMAQSIYFNIGKTPGVISIKINSLSGSVLIHYDDKILNYNDLIILIEETRQHHGLEPKIAPNLITKWPTVHVLLICAALFIIYIKIKCFGRSKTSPSEGVVDFAIFLSIISGYPVFSQKLDHWKFPPVIGFEKFADIVSLFLLILKESFEGLFISLMVSFARLVGTVNLTKSNYEIMRHHRLPARVRVLVGEEETLVPLSILDKQWILVVKNGEIIMADGKVSHGRAEVDESRITGIPDHLIKEENSEVYAGSMVVSGKIYILVEKVGSNTFQGRLIESFRNKNRSAKNTIHQQRINSQSLFSLIFTAIYYLFSGNKLRSITMLLAAIPSAAGLALSTATGLALGNAAREKVFIRDENIFSAAAKINTIALDKTGTLSLNAVEIEDIILIDKKIKSEDILRLASVADGELRPGLPEAIQRKALEAQIGLSAVSTIKQNNNSEMPDDIIIGDQSFMAANNVSLGKVMIKLPRLRHLGQIPIFVARNKKIIGILAVSELLKPKARDTIEKLRALGIERIVIVTGDSQEAAEIIADKIGITEVHYDLSAQDKADLIRRWKDKGYSVAMVGDGLDDTPAMAQADLGICIGSTGINSSAQAAEIVIASENLDLLADTFKLLQKAIMTGEENLNIALAQNIVGLGLGTTGIITPTGAALLSNMGIITVLFNSMSI